MAYTVSPVVLIVALSAFACVTFAQNILCSPAQRKAFLCQVTADSEVCAYEEDGTQYVSADGTVGTRPNYCRACNIADVRYYTTGSCSIRRALSEDGKPSLKDLYYENQTLFDPATTPLPDEPMYTSLRVPGFHKCPQKRPYMCGAEHAPSCAYKFDGQVLGLFASFCNACSHQEAIYVKQGFCEEGHQFESCPAQRSKACTKDLRPVCGRLFAEYACESTPCETTYSNKCMACADERVEYFYAGECLAR